MLLGIVLAVAIVVTATALFQIAGRLGAFGYQNLELAARQSFARNGNIALAAALWLIWAFVL